MWHKTIHIIGQSPAYYKHLRNIILLILILLTILLYLTYDIIKYMK